MSGFDKLRTKENGWVTPEELRDLLADEGYAAGDRTQFLKSVLTRLAADTTGNGGPSRERLREEVEAILCQEQEKHDQEPVAKDNL